MTCQFIKEKFPAAHHLKLLLAADRIRRLVRFADGSSNPSRYGSGAEGTMINQDGTPRLNPNMSTESILISTVPMDSDHYRAMISQVDRRSAATTKAGRSVDGSLSQFKNSRGSPEKEQEGKKAFKEAFKHRKDPQEERSRELAVVRPNFAQKILDKLGIPINVFARTKIPPTPPAKLSIPPPPFPPEYQPSRDRFLQTYNFAPDSLLTLFCFSCDA